MQSTPVGLSPLIDRLQLHGVEMEVRDGWLAPDRFGSVAAELEAARSAVAVGELVGIGALEVVGTSLPDLAEQLGVAGVAIGAVAPVALVETGEPRWCRLTRTRARILLQRSAAAAARTALGSVDRCLHVTDISSGHTTLAVIGPQAPDLLARLVRLDLDPRAFPDRRVALTGAVGVPLQVLRWDRGPRLAYELTVGRDVAEHFWEALIHAGDGLGLQPIGAEALTRLNQDNIDDDVKV